MSTKNITSSCCIFLPSFLGKVHFMFWSSLDCRNRKKKFFFFKYVLVTPQRKLHKHIYYCAFPGNVSKEIIIWHPLNALKQMKTHCNLHSYWKDLQHCTMWSFMLATPYSGYKMQLCLKNWQVQDSKFLHTWDCLADFFLLTQTQVRPSSSMAEQQCGNQEWIFPHPSSPNPSLQTNHPAQISKKSQRGILAVVSPGLQPAQIKKMVSRCRRLPLPPPSL